MRIIVPSDGSAAAEQRLAALMLNIEHAAIVYGGNLQELPSPHQPWPLIELKPLTKRGQATAVHYAASVGLVFYTAGAVLNIGALVNRLAGLLEQLPIEHLKRSRAVMASPVSVLRHKGRLRDETLIVGPRKCYKKALSGKEELPTRLMLWTPSAELELPPHYSIRAAFTWVFMPVTAALAVQDIGSAAAANAMIASVLYDASMLSCHREGADFFRLGLRDFNIRPLPGFLAAPGMPATAVPTQAMVGATAERNGALVVRGGTLSYVGDHECLRARARPFDRLPRIEWEPDGYLALGPGRYQCCACSAPVAGDVVVLTAPAAPPANLHRDWWFCPRAPGTSLLLVANAQKKLLLCTFCWNSLESPDCLTAHMHARPQRTTAPHTQAQACAQCPGFERLVPLLSGKVRPIAATPGAFVVEFHSPDGGQELVIIAGEILGPTPALTTPGVAELNLPVLAGLRIAEA